ncbi:MAG TPA: acetyl-CoA hydrolase/transferase C-terminal domain-containing protein [Acidimicrobiales bacterium]|jgi:acyl-CoA hydrolase
MAGTTDGQGTGADGWVVVADGPGTPTCDPVAEGRRSGIHEGSLWLGWTLESRDWADRLGDWPAATYMPAYALRDAARDGRVRYLPVRLGSIPALLGGWLRPRLAVVRAVPRGGGFAFAENVGYADTAARLADEVVVQVVEDAPDIGGPLVEGRIVRVLDGGEAATPPALTEPGEADRRIAEAAASLIPDGATVQYGVGALPDAVVAGITSRVSVVSGLITDAVARLDDQGLLAGEVIASYAWGPAVVALAGTGRVRPVGLAEFHRGARLASTPNFVAVNTALEVGLDGAVNIERAGGRQVAGMGGHADYSAAASASTGGFSIVVLRSSRAGRSSIVVRPEVVSTPRTDVHVLVTEHGIADLRGLDDEGRRAAIIAVADPEHREALEQAAG